MLPRADVPPVGHGSEKGAPPGESWKCGAERGRAERVVGGCG